MSLFVFSERMSVKTARKDETQDWVLSSENLTSSLTCIGKTARKDDTLGIGLDEG
jgi:hypothetical protein